ncbi:hypothetical protein GCM10010254_25350 [Streptomyces chromofuscus]|nr:hypothetical protein GCM10010254_25350 [Streptomyces chromofuscus]
MRHGCCSVGDDTLWGVNRRKKGAGNTLTALQSIRAARPDGAPIYVILDNQPAHKGADIRRWAKKHKADLCFTSTAPALRARWAGFLHAVSRALCLRSASTSALQDCGEAPRHHRPR